MKKAIAVTELMLMLIAIVSGIGLLVLTKKGTEKAGCMRDVELCRESYAFYKGFAKKVSAPKIDCVAISPPNCVKGEQAKKPIEVEGNEEEKKQETMHIIAENLKWCWYKTLGNQNKIGEDFGNARYRTAFWGEAPDVDFCLVCSEFTMPDDVHITAAEWNAYLKKQIPGEQKTYEQYINIDPTRETEWREKGKYQKAFVPDSILWRKTDLNYRNIDFWSGRHYYVVSVSAEETADNALGLYISDEIYCGEADPQIHYQLT